MRVRAIGRRERLAGGATSAPMTTPQGHFGVASIATLRHALRWAPAILFAAALVAIHTELQGHHYADLSESWRSVPRATLAIAVLLTVANYTVLVGYDWLALRFCGHRDVPFRRILLTSFVGFGISNNTGHAWASGGSIRYRFYSDVGVPGWDVAKISLFLALTYVVGVLTLGTAGTIVAAESMRGIPRLQHVVRLMMGCGAVGLLGYWGAAFFWRKPFRVLGAEVTFPSPLLALSQTVLSSLDIVLASLVLWVFIESVPGLTFPVFLTIYSVALLAALISQVPGGIGVFEGAFLWLAGPLFNAAHPTLVAGLVLYRAVYYFLPLAAAGALLLFGDLRTKYAHLLKVGQIASRLVPATVRQVFSVLLFLTGGVLLVSGATPPLPEDVQWLRDVIPLPVLELSHLTGSLVGVLLLFLARGILLRLDAAWYGALCLLAVGVVASLLKGLDWQEAAVLAVMFAAICGSRRHFYRKSSLFRLSLNPSWLLMIAVVIAGTTWLGFFSYKHVEYSNDLWWQFSYKNDASRFIRSLIVIGVPTLAMLIRHAFGVYRPRVRPTASPPDLERALPLIRRSADTQPFLALVGDKALFWSEDGQAFIAYTETSGYWIAMGDPAGDEKSYEALLWRFREEADRYGARIVFYQVSDDHLPLYLDLGLALLKLGQEACVALPHFSLDGRRRENLRAGRKKLLKLNYVFKILDGADVGAAMPRLHEISTHWLAQKKTREKRFSVGCFDASYLARTRIAVATTTAGRIMAFANLLETEGKEELSVDLMRYDPESPRGVMDFLFAELMLWGRDQGFQWFNLGIAPLAGLERHPLAPLWHKIGTVIFDLGEEFYNFEGLYEYKAKFEPKWRPRYLAAPHGFSAPIVLLTIARLIAGSMKGIVAK